MSSVRFPPPIVLEVLFMSSEGAKKAWETRRKNAEILEKAISSYRKARSDAAKRAWITRNSKPAV